MHHWHFHFASHMRACGIGHGPSSRILSRKSSRDSFCECGHPGLGVGLGNFGGAPHSVDKRKAAVDRPASFEPNGLSVRAWILSYRAAVLPHLDHPPSSPLSGLQLSRAVSTSHSARVFSRIASRAVAEGCRSRNWTASLVIASLSVSGPWVCRFLENVSTTR